MSRLILPLPGNEPFAAQLADALGAELGAIETRHFPDGESYVRLHGDPSGRAVDLVCSLAQPDRQFLPLVFAADAARELGASAVNLVAPYLAYMRQDIRFQPGECISSLSFARLLSSTFDTLLTVEPLEGEQTRAIQGRLQADEPQRLFAVTPEGIAEIPRETPARRPGGR